MMRFVYQNNISIYDFLLYFIDACVCCMNFVFACVKNKDEKGFRKFYSI